MLVPFSFVVPVPCLQEMELVEEDEDLPPLDLAGLEAPLPVTTWPL